MFFYDKDMERMMQLKKQEIMREMEVAKKRILEELMCVKRAVHTDFCDLLADYNRIDFQMKQLLATFKEEIAKITTGYSDLIALKFAEYNDMVVDKIEQLEILEREIELYFSNTRIELEAAREEIQRLVDFVAQYEDTIKNGATKKELDALRTELLEKINNIDISKQLDTLRTEIFEKVTEVEALAASPSDWNENDESSPAFIKNRTHYEENVGKVLLPKATFTSEQTQGFAYPGFGVPYEIDFVEGKQYVVTWNDNEFICTPMHHDSLGTSFIGNPRAVQSNYPDNGMPFISFYHAGLGGTLVATLEGIVTVELSISEYDIAVHKIHDKFIPQSDWNETDESKGTFIKNKPFGWKSATLKESTAYVRMSTVETGLYRLSFGSFNYRKMKLVGYKLCIHKPTQYSHILGDLLWESDIVVPKMVEGIPTFPDMTVTINGESILLTADTSYVGESNTSPGDSLYKYNFNSTVYKDWVSVLYEVDIDADTVPAYYLADEFKPYAFLQTDNEGNTVWVQDPILVSPSKKLFKIAVSDDGELSAVAVTTE